MVQKWPRFQILDPFSDKEIHDERETEGSKNRNKKTSSHLMLKNLLVFHYYQSKAMVASSSTAAVTIAGGLISSRSVIARSRPAPVMIQQQRPSARNVKTISWISSPSKSLRVVNAGAAATSSGGVPLPPLDLTEENIELVLAEARVELAQLFDTSVGITGQVELSELDGPFVKISLKGRFWHKRSTVLARVGNYLKQRIPEILEVDIEDEKQLDDSPENF